MQADSVLLQLVYQGAIEAFSRRENISLRRAFDALYKSLLYQEISQGVSDMHCRSDDYLAEELKRKWNLGAVSHNRKSSRLLRAL